ncbi:hypothetical protein [Actinospica robiniae]|uniref:hypothetical protein n=1 Tax=Actinospica robiniae TaxID=304901 RepID=UPI0003F71BEA|nr:hypothetical protein [Actinospica robiniae]
MPTKPSAPADPAADPSGEPPRAAGSLRADLAPSAGVGVVMGFLAATEGAGPGYGAVVGAVGCGVVLGMLALKRAFYGS